MMIAPAGIVPQTGDSQRGRAPLQLWRLVVRVVGLDGHRFTLPLCSRVTSCHSPTSGDKRRQRIARWSGFWLV